MMIPLFLEGRGFLSFFKIQIHQNWGIKLDLLSPFVQIQVCANKISPVQYIYIG